MKIEIKNKEDIVRILDYLHDTGFRKEDITYDSSDRRLTIITKEYEFKGRFIQRKTGKVKTIYSLTLQNVKSCDIKFTGKANEDGYYAIGEDFFNTIRFQNNEIILITTFQEIDLKIDSFKGHFEMNAC